MVLCELSVSAKENLDNNSNNSTFAFPNLYNSWFNTGKNIE